MKRDTVIYLIRPVGQKGPVKIGVSMKPHRRLADLQAASPVPLEIAHTIPGGHRAETMLHHRFRDLRLHGEWFDVDEDFLDFVEYADCEDYAFMERWYRPPAPGWIERHALIGAPGAYRMLGVFG